MVLADFIDFFKNNETAKKQRVKMRFEGGGVGALTVFNSGKALRNL